MSGIRLLSPDFSNKRTYDEVGERTRYQISLDTLLSSQRYNKVQYLSEEIINYFRTQGRVIIILQRHYHSQMNEGNDAIKSLMRGETRKILALEEMFDIYTKYNTRNDIDTRLSSRGLEDAKFEIQQTRNLLGKNIRLKIIHTFCSKHFRAKQSIHPKFPELNGIHVPYTSLDILGERAMSPDGMPSVYSEKRDSTYKGLTRFDKTKKFYQQGYSDANGVPISEHGDDHFKRTGNILYEVPKLLKEKAGFQEGIGRMCTHQLTATALLQHVLGKDQYDRQFLFNMNGAYKLENGGLIVFSFNKDDYSDWQLHAYNVKLENIDSTIF